MNASIYWSTDVCKVQLQNGKGQIQIAHQLTAEMTDFPMLSLFLKKGQLVAISQKKTRKTYDRVICLQPEEAMELDYLQRQLEPLVQTNNWLDALQANDSTRTDYLKEVAQLLQWFDYPIVSHETSEKAKLPVKKQGKPQHRWSKEVSVIPFQTDYLHTKATIYWNKRNELLIKSGAHLLPEPPVNKDGSLGFSARFGLKIREEHAASFNDQWTTTEEIILKSVNEVGLFLYFAGTNSWLQFTDESGKTLDEWTVVQ